MLYEHYVDLAGYVDRLITELAEHRDAATREQVVALLEALDLLHREGLVRLADALRAGGAGDALDRAASDDPVVRVLLGLYGLAELDLPPDDSPAHDAGTVAFIPAERLRVHRRTPAAPEGA